jgi:hypothetical protein
MKPLDDNGSSSIRDAGSGRITMSRVSRPVSVKVTIERGYNGVGGVSVFLVLLSVGEIKLSIEHFLQVKIQTWKIPTSFGQ